MATLVLSAIGSAVGGPIGGAIGAVVGQQVDGLIFGRGKSEGPRLQELSVSTSSYGTPLPRHYGRNRTAGSIIWATDLIESKETNGGGKKSPKTTTYSYSVSFAVALASGPILDVGRIWADGDLLRGTAGDLKTGGTMRLYYGHGDEDPDPLISAALEGRSTAHRDGAYVVFEDLELGDFGNRIPALSFEIIGSDGLVSLAQLSDDHAVPGADSATLDGLEGLVLNGAPLADTLASLNTLYPVEVIDTNGSLEVRRMQPADHLPPMLPLPAQGWDETDGGRQTGFSSQRAAKPVQPARSLRYYDRTRDYQPSVQHAVGRPESSATSTLEFPATLQTSAAQLLIEDRLVRARYDRETLAWRIIELDPRFVPGQLVRVPDQAGIWRISDWEWRERGIDLELHRLPHNGAVATNSNADAGDAGVAIDAAPSATILRAFELPWDGTGSSADPQTYVFAGGATRGWNGAMLYRESASGLDPARPTGRQQAITGTLSAALSGSSSLLFEPDGTAVIHLETGVDGLPSTDLAGIASGTNRLLIGQEILQFACAEETAPAIWTLTGLLRGRGGTEAFAKDGHSAGAPVAFIDEAAEPLAPFGDVLSDSARVAAIGPFDSEPVFADIVNLGISRRPLAPVHGRTGLCPDGQIMLSWVRRARGQWAWRDGVEVLLVEEREAYLIGVGSVENPSASWEVSQSHLLFSATEWADLAATYPGNNLWVRQIGNHALSDATLLHVFSIQN